MSLGQGRDVRKPQFVLVAIVLTGAVFSCGRSDKVVIDRLESIKEGGEIAFRLEPGLYEYEITASHAGAVVKFIGSPTPSPNGPRQEFKGLVWMQSAGQLVLDDPSGLGGTQGTSVTVKVTKLRR